MTIGQYNPIYSGVIFDQTFLSANHVADGGGTEVGSPTYDSGIVLDGSSDYLTYHGLGKFVSQDLSIVMEFTPDFDYDEDATRCLFDATNGSIYRCIKNNNAASNVLSINLGNTLIVDIAEGTYSGAWSVGEKNTLIISSTGSSTNVWLNGTQIVTNDTTAWTPDAPATLYIGSIFNGTGLFDGTISRFQIYNRTLTSEEATDLYQKDIYGELDPPEWIIHGKNDFCGVRTSNVASDGDMEWSGIEAWHATAAATVTKQAGSPGGTGSQVLQVAGSQNEFASQQNKLIIRARYTVTGWAKGDGTAAPEIKHGGTVAWAGTTSSDWQAVSATFEATATELRMNIGTANGTVQFDDIVITNINGLVDGDMEDSGISAWGNYNTSTIEKVTTDPHSGTQALRITKAGALGGASQANRFTLNLTYKISGWVRSDGTAIPSILNQSFNDIMQTGADTEWHYFEAYYTPTVGTNVIFGKNTAGTWVEFDDLSIQPAFLDCNYETQSSQTFSRGSLNGANGTITPAAVNPNGYEGTGTEFVLVGNQEHPGDTEEWTLAFAHVGNDTTDSRIAMIGVPYNTYEASSNGFGVGTHPTTYDYRVIVETKAWGTESGVTSRGFHTLVLVHTSTGYTLYIDDLEHTSTAGNFTNNDKGEWTSLLCGENTRAPFAYNKGRMFSPRYYKFAATPTQVLKIMHELKQIHNL